MHKSANIGENRKSKTNQSKIIIKSQRIYFLLKKVEKNNQKHIKNNNNRSSIYKNKPTSTQKKHSNQSNFIFQKNNAKHVIRHPSSFAAKKNLRKPIKNRQKSAKTPQNIQKMKIKPVNT
eukprot:TRINITY_DN2224_c0_g1_i1.p1 TRINITY_DN2224_c0_g1~~TRINITY_DN2224_c0_g1_i1.p1  ORF type:complete len:120 (-),score=17.64 TRINITY_DN2224_c0_g1_i1:350-709(-)